MTKQSYLNAEFVEFIPDIIEDGRVYISQRYSTAVHSCCCGCGLEVITPLNTAQWRLEKTENSVSLYPSIGNWNFPCKSHYWIIDGKVQWSYAMSAQQISEIQKRDRLDIEEYLLEDTKQSIPQYVYAKFVTIANKLHELWKRILK